MFAVQSTAVVVVPVYKIDLNIFEIVWIDVFPLSGLPDDEDERRAYFNRFYETDKSMWESFYQSDGNVESFPRYFDLQAEMLQRYDFDQTKYVGVLGTQYKERDFTRRYVYEKTVRMPFEDITVNVPTGYKEYLSNLYGNDWYKIPEERKRKSHHEIDAFWL